VLTRNDGIEALVVTVMLAACACVPQPNERLNSPPQGESDRHPGWAAYYTYHNDQGMLADMSIADIHFVPHSTALSGVGEARLARYAELLAARGGTLNYDSALTDDHKGLVNERLCVAKAFMAEAVPGAEAIDVIVGPAGGRGMSAQEALGAEDVAKQAEPRPSAYYLTNREGLVIEDD